MSVTIKDIAKIANKTPSTVSRVLSNAGGYSSKTEKEIKRIAEDLGYNKNLAAEELVKQHGKVIGVMMMDATTNFSGDIINGIEKQVTEEGFSAIWVHAGYQDAERQKKALALLFERRVSGIIIISLTLEDSNFTYLKNMNIPYIYLSVNPKNNAPFIASNDFQMAYKGTQYLINKGHQKIAFTGIDFDEKKIGSERIKGYQQALQDYNIKGYKKWIIEGDYSYESGYVSAKNKLTKMNVSATLAASDEIALGVINGLSLVDISIPKDFSVMSIDGTSISQMYRPRLHCVRQDFFNIGFEGAKALINTISNYKPLKSTYIPFSLIEGETIKHI